MNSAFSTTVQGLLVIYLAWSSYAINELQRSVAVLGVKLESAADDRYRRSDAIKDFSNAHEHRLLLEKRIDALERWKEGKR